MLTNSSNQSTGLQLSKNYLCKKVYPVYLNENKNNKIQYMVALNRNGNHKQAIVLKKQNETKLA